VAYAWPEGAERLMTSIQASGALAIGLFQQSCIITRRAWNWSCELEKEVCDHSRIQCECRKECRYESKSLRVSYSTFVLCKSLHSPDVWVHTPAWGQCTTLTSGAHQGSNVACLHSLHALKIHVLIPWLKATMIYDIRL